jgi:hypothetical protein
VRTKRVSPRSNPWRMKCGDWHSNTSGKQPALIVRTVLRSAKSRGSFRMNGAGPLNFGSGSRRRKQFCAYSKDIVLESSFRLARHRAPCRRPPHHRCDHRAGRSGQGLFRQRATSPRLGPCCSGRRGSLCTRWAPGIAPDIAQARLWYEKGAELGSDIAAQRLATLVQTHQ